MRITLIGPVYPYRGGIAHYTAHLANKLLEAGYEIQVISFRRQYPGWLYPGASDKDPSTNPLTVSAAYLLDPIYPWTWWQAVREIKLYKPEMVAIQWWTTFWSPAFSTLSWLLQREEIPVIYMIHNVLPHEAKKWDHWLSTLALRKGKGFITHTLREKDRLLNLLPNADIKIHPIPTYDKLPHSRISKSKAREALGLPDNIPLLLSFGIVRPYKGLTVLLNALGILRRQNECFRLLIAGEFWDDKDDYMQQIKSLDLEEYVRIEDRYLPDEEVAQIFSAADILIAPYVGGTQSAVASWGLGFGLPLIVSDKVAAGITEQNLHRVTVVPAGDPHQLARAIQEFLKKYQVQKTIPQAPTDLNTGWNELIQGLVSFTMKGHPTTQ
jgi:glycosyltransferase involved in cell wall biosynthesis